MLGKPANHKNWRQTYLVDRRQIESFQRDIAKLFSFNASVPIWNEKIAKLVSDSQQSEAKGLKQQRGIFNEVEKIVNEVNSLRTTLKNYEQSNQYLLKVQNLSESCLAKFANFKQKMGEGYQQLSEDEAKLIQQLNFYDKKITQMGNKENNDINQQQVQNVEKKQTKLYDNFIKKEIKKEKSPQKQIEVSRLEVLEAKIKEKQLQCDKIQNQIIKLGKFLGWNETDHTDFITIWNKQPNKNYFMIEEQMAKYFSYYTTEQIQEHMNKHIKYKKLTEEKKECIYQHKLLKEQKKSEELRLFAIEQKEIKGIKNRQQAKKREQEEQKIRKQKLQEWKKEKLQKQKEQMIKKKREQDQKREIQMMKRREAEQRNKQLLEEWKMEEQAKKQTLRRVQSARKPPQIDKQTEERIRARQQQLLHKKLQIVSDKRREQELARQKQQEEREKKIIKYSHVNTKLEEKTKAVKEKQRTKFDGKQRKEANTFGGQLLMTGVRAVPNWMKGI